MPSEIATIQPREMPATLKFSADQIDLIKRTIAVGCTDDELALFVEVCRGKQLDPFSRQIYAIKRWDSKQKREVMAIQIGIDGYRLEAQRTGKYAGQGAIEWCDEQGNWTDVWLHDSPPAAARCTVYREGFDRPITRVAKFSSYCARGKEGQPVANWRTMPEVMIGKCAEALALRTAFPKELGGTTIPEEMEHDHENVVHYDATVTVEDRKPSERLPPASGEITPQDIKLMWQEVDEAAAKLGVEQKEARAAIRNLIKDVYHVPRYGEMTRETYAKVIDLIDVTLAALIKEPEGPAYE